MHRFTVLPALLVLALPTAGQFQGRRVPATGTPRHFQLDLDTGILTPSAAGPQALVSTPCFENNVDQSCCADALLYPPTFELFDWGVKSCGGSGLIDRIVIGYASQAVPVLLGGPGASVTVRFYENAHGFGVHGNLVAEFNLSGLPSSFPPPSGQPPASDPFYLTLDLGEQAFFLPDGGIGWSYENPDGLTAPLLVTARLALGVRNVFDVYMPGPATDESFVGTFQLPPGGSSNDPLENSFFVVLWQNDTPAQLTPLPDAGNPALLSGDLPRVGQPWSASVDLSGVPGASGSVVFVSNRRLTATPTPFGELIADPVHLAAPPSIRADGQHAFDIPLDANLLGRSFFAQGGALGAAGFQLTNALELTLGSL